MPAHALTPRAVQVIVKVESAQFRAGLGDSRRQKIESTIATEVAASLRKQFPVVEWLVTADASAAAGCPTTAVAAERPEIHEPTGAAVPAGRLIAAVTEKCPATGEPANALPEVNLEWRAEANGKTLDMPRVFPQLLYSSSNADRPVHDDRGAFLKLLREKVVGWVQSETNSEHLRVQFLRYVPLATSVTIPPGQRLVVVPLPWQTSRISERAVLLVTYRGNDAGTPQDTRVVLTGLAPRLTDPLLGSTQSQVEKCTRGGAPIDAAQLWGTCMDPLSRDPPRPVVVRVDDYIYDANPDVEGGVILDEN